MADVKTISLGDRLVRVTAVIQNDGFLPTNVTQKAVEHRIAKPVEVRLDLDKAELIAGRERTDVGHIDGNGRRRRHPAGAAQSNEISARWNGSSG